MVKRVYLSLGFIKVSALVRSQLEYGSMMWNLEYRRNVRRERENPEDSIPEFLFLRKSLLSV